MTKTQKTMDLRSFWERSGKVQKTAPTEAPKPQPIVLQSLRPKPPSILLQSLRFILRQGLAFRGHDEIKESLNQGNFHELLKWLADNLDGANKAVLQNALKDPEMTGPKTIEDLVNACSRETTRLIRQDLGEENFAILACLFTDACHNEQLVVCLRYVDKKGRAVERFLGVVHVDDPRPSTIKSAIDSLLRDHSLSWSRVRGQGYDGAGNMRAHVKGLKKIIMDESPSAHYVHCFAQELHLTLVPVLKENGGCADFFERLGFLVSLLEISCRKAQMLQVPEAQQVLEGLNQAKCSSKMDDPSQGFHYKTCVQISILYPTIRSVLIMIGGDHTHGAEAVNARKVLIYFESFEFVFMTHLLMNILGCTSVLNRCLQLKNSFMVNGIEIINITKHLLEKMRGDDEWVKFHKEVTTFCAKHDIKVPSMDDIYEPVLKPKGFLRKVKNLQHYRVEIFTSIHDRALQELNDRFDEMNTDFLLNVASLDPAKSFYPYNKDKLLKLARSYPKDLSSTDLLLLPNHLSRFIDDMREDERFREVKSFVELSVMLVETKKSLKHPIVYKLLKLLLVLPIATASVERVFSATDFVKNKLANRVGGQLLNDYLVTFIEREVFMQVKDEALASCFQATVGE